MQDYSNSSALAMKLMQSCTKQLIYATQEWEGYTKPVGDVFKNIFLKEDILILPGLYQWKSQYCETSNISHTKSQNLNDSHLVLQLSLLNPLKPDVKLRMKM